MLLDISLPSGDIKKVELEYERLDKHCFSCRSLSHEKDDCLYIRPSERRDNHSSISQTRTLDRLEASKRSQDNRKVARGHPPALAFRNRLDQVNEQYRSSHREYHVNENPRQPLQSWDSHRETHHRETRRPLFNDRSYSARTLPREVSGDPRSVTRDQGVFVSPRLPATQLLSLGKGSSGHSKHGEQVWVEKTGHSLSAQISQASKTPSPRPPREQMQTTLFPQNDMRPDERPTVSQEHTSAVQRLSGSASRVPLLVNGVADSDSGRLQEVEIHYLEENLQNHPIGSSCRASSSRAPVNEKLSLP
ncbi:unnamed protein product, partial [Brassica oleracea var. botrytis]